MRKLIVIVFVIIGLTTNAQKATIDLTNPPKVVTLFGSGIFSTALNERDFALSPDGNEIYFTISTPKSTFQTIVFSRRTNNGWTKPEVVSFGGQFSDLEPAFSADGNTLYFASNRPLVGNAIKDFDIWKVTRVGTGWGKPENLGATINSGSDEFYPSIAKNGNMYFTATYADGPGREDIYVSRFESSGYQKPIALDTAINSKFYEFNAFVSPNEDYILFTSYGRKDDSGGGDLYISQKDAKGKWQAAQNLKQLNSKQLDYCPYVSPDGKSLFFTSERHELPASFATQADYKSIAELQNQPLNGSGNIYWIEFKAVLNSIK
jgi:Tol biopolymer transport system component